MKSLLLVMVLTGAVSASGQVLVRHVGPVSCSKVVPRALWLKIPLQMTINNPLGEPFTVGRVEILRESFYRKDEQGKLTLISTSPMPDIFEGVEPLFPSKGSTRETM